MRVCSFVGMLIIAGLLVSCSLGGPTNNQQVSTLAVQPWPYQYAVTDLGTAPPHGFAAFYALNAYGEVLGHHFAGGDFLWLLDQANSAQGSYDSAATAPQASGNLVDLNDDGQVVGNFLNQEFLWTPATPHGPTGTTTKMAALTSTAPSYASGNTTSLNNQGQIIGQTISANTKGFVWTPTVPNGTSGSLFNLNAQISAKVSYPLTINDAGEILGSSGSGSGFPTDFHWMPNGAGGTFITIAPPASDAPINLISLNSINDDGQILANTSQHSTGTPNAIEQTEVWTPSQPHGNAGVLTRISPLPGDTQVWGAGMNAGGSVVGYSTQKQVYQNFAQQGSHAIVWTPQVPNGTSGTSTDLGLLPGDEASFAQAINANGIVVGASYVVKEAQLVKAAIHLFVWDRQHGLHDVSSLLINDPGIIFEQALPNGINAAGQIIAIGRIGQNEHLFLLTPQP